MPARFARRVSPVWAGINPAPTEWVKTLIPSFFDYVHDYERERDHEG